MKTNFERTLRIPSAAGLILALFIIGFTGNGYLADAADTYEIDASHSMIIFRAKHKGVSYNYGRFNEFSGNIVMDSADMSKSMIELEVKAASVDTAHNKRDQHLRSPDFFSAKQFPVITFKSTKVRMKDGEDNMLEVTGELELLGVKKSITVDVEITGSGEDDGEALIGFETTFMIKRSEFGMNYGIGAVSDDIRLTVSIEGVRK